MSEETSSAAVAAQRVQAIVEAAEKTAREIEDKARVDAAAQVANVKDAIDGLVAQAATLQARMDEIAVALGEAKAAVDAMAAEATALGVPRDKGLTDRHPGDTPTPEPVAADRPAESEPAMASADPPPVAVDEPADAAAPDAPAMDASAADATRAPAPEGARLVALNMALSGKPRDETARYLRENFELDDEDGLLDEVYAKVGS